MAPPSAVVSEVRSAVPESASGVPVTAGDGLGSSKGASRLGASSGANRLERAGRRDRIAFGQLGGLLVEATQLASGRGVEADPADLREVDLDPGVKRRHRDAIEALALVEAGQVAIDQARRNRNVHLAQDHDHRGGVMEAEADALAQQALRHVLPVPASTRDIGVVSERAACPGGGWPCRRVSPGRAPRRALSGSGRAMFRVFVPDDPERTAT